MVGGASCLVFIILITIFGQNCESVVKCGSQSLAREPEHVLLGRGQSGRSSFSSGRNWSRGSAPDEDEEDEEVIAYNGRRPDVFRMQGRVHIMPLKAGARVPDPYSFKHAKPYHGQQFPSDRFAPRGYRNPYGGDRGYSGYDRMALMMDDDEDETEHMDPEEVFDGIQSLVDHPGWFYVSFKCPPVTGKYICKIQCAKRNPSLTGTCDTGYCGCIPKLEKKYLKEMGLPVSTKMSYETDCGVKRRRRKCRKDCKNITPDGSFDGQCLGDICYCVTYPAGNAKKENACKEALRTLEKIEERMVRDIRVTGGKEIMFDGEMEGLVKKLGLFMTKQIMAVKNSEACSPQDLRASAEVLRRIVNGLATLGQANADSTNTASAVKIPSPSPSKVATETADPMRQMIAATN